jgi:hypothetical protein
MIGEPSVEPVADYGRQAELEQRFRYDAPFFVVTS